MSFLQGFVTGFSRSADTAIQKYLESDNQLKNRLAEKRIARAETEEARFRKEFDEYKRDIKSLAKKAGGVDNAQYILDLYGYDEGKKTIEDLYQKQMNGGKNISDLFKLADRVGPSVTVDQLATFYTPPIKIGSGKSMANLGGGITKLLGGENYIQKAVLKETDAVVGKLTKASLSDIPETLTAIDALENYEVGYSLNYEAEYKRLMNVSQNFLSKGNKDKAAQIRISADSNYMLMKNLDKKEYSQAELKSLGKDLEKRLVNVHSIKGKYTLEGQFISPAESKEAYETVSNIATEFESIAESARSQFNLNSSYIKLKLTEAITKNLVPVIVPASDAFSKAIIKLTDEPLYKTTTTATGKTISSNQPSSQYGVSAVPSEIAKIKSLSGSAKQKAIIDAQKLFGVNMQGLNELNKQLRQLGLI